LGSFASMACRIEAVTRANAGHGASLDSVGENR
jgi:hypothetical protein